MINIEQGIPLLKQIRDNNLEFDQMLYRALEISASRPDIEPEDKGFPDSYITLALYRLNTILTRIINLENKKYNLFHEYKLAPPCLPEEVIPGFRFAKVLTKAIQLAQPEKTIGVGHFLRAIVNLSIDESPIDIGLYPGSVIQNTFSVETLLWGLGYTAWTPVSDAPEVVNILNSLAGREQTEDIQYIMTLEEGRIIFRPTSILDHFFIRDKKDNLTSGLGIITHFKDNFAAITTSEILELEDLVNNRSVRESDLQRFFENHSHFFRMWDFRDIYPHVYLTREEEGTFIPDFILVNKELQKAMVLDLKLPKAKIVSHKSNRIRFSSAVEEARAQLLEYKDWFEDKHNRQKLKERLGMEIFRPRLGVVIGSNQDFRDELEKQKLVSRYSDLEVLTYDDVVNQSKSRLLLIQSATR